MEANAPILLGYHQPFPTIALPNKRLLAAYMVASTLTPFFVFLVCMKAIADLKVDIYLGKVLLATVLVPP